MISLEDLCLRYKRIYTGSIADVLDSKGLTNQILPSNIRPLTEKMKIAGPAFTVKGMPDPRIPTAEDEAFALGLFEKITPYCVVIRDGCGDTRASHWGELTSITAQARGCQGAVINGGVRDTGKILEMGFPVFAKYRTPADMDGRWRIVDFHVPLLIEGVRVNPGDFLVGDCDGIVCVPKELVEQVLIEAEKKVSRENIMREELKKGASPVEIRKKYGNF